jgi:U4/U6 small nuclear ribonucleoprotein PRP31
MEDLIDDLDSSGGEEEEEYGGKVPSHEEKKSAGDDDGNNDDDHDGVDVDLDREMKVVNEKGLIAMAMKNKVKFTIPTLRSADWYKDCIGQVRNVMSVVVEEGSEASIQLAASLGNEDSPAYKLITASSKVIMEVEESMESTLTYIKEIYSKRFPELEELVPNKVEYVQCAQRIGNETDMSKVKLSDILPSNTIMVINVTGTMTSGVPLATDSLAQFDAACAEMLALHTDRAAVLKFLESRMHVLAPNLSVLVGAQLASTLIGLAGNLTSLSKIPGGNIEVMGHDKRTLQGMSMASSTTQFGALLQAPLVQAAPRSLRRKMIKVLSGKVALVSRVDAYHNHPDGELGRTLHGELAAKLEKWQEPDKARTKKALPVPDEEKKKRRGGKRARKMKERLGLTELGAQRNRMALTAAENSEYGDSAMGLDMGMVGRKDTNKLRKAETTKKTLQLSKKARRALDASAAAFAVSAGTSGGETGGTVTSLVVTPGQGNIELNNPALTAESRRQQQVEQANKSWFSSTLGFNTGSSGDNK